MKFGLSLLFWLSSAARINISEPGRATCPSAVGSCPWRKRKSCFRDYRFLSMMQLTEYGDFEEGDTLTGHLNGVVNDLVPIRGETLRLTLNSTRPNGKKLTGIQNYRKQAAQHHWNLVEAEGLACDNPLHLGYLNIAWGRGNVAPWVSSRCSCKDSGFRIKEPYRGNNLRYYLQSPDGEYTYYTYVKKNNALGEWLNQMGEWQIYTGKCPKNCRHRVFDADVTQSLGQAKFWRIQNDRQRVGGPDDWVALAEEKDDETIAVTVKEGMDTVMAMGLMSVLEHRNEFRVFPDDFTKEDWGGIKTKGGRLLRDKSN